MPALVSKWPGLFYGYFKLQLYVLKWETALCTWCFFHSPLQLRLNLVHDVLQLIQELLQMLHVVVVE